MRMNRMNFSQAHDAFIKHHLSRRTGERRRRLELGHAHAEKLFCRNIWWQVVGHFHNLHPEYEVRDWRGRSYFADFAYITALIRLIIEIKGYKAHVVDMDRQKYCNELNRETFLFAAGYHVISFAYDDIEQRPDICINLLRMVLSKYMSPTTTILNAESRTTIIEREMIRYMAQLARPVKPLELRSYLDIDYRHAKRILTGLCTRGWLKPVYGPNRNRISYYELAKNPLDYFDRESW